MSKELVFQEDARAKLKEGIDILADAVGPTLGPKGKNVGLESPWGAPKITNDGKTITSEISLKDQYANMGASMGKEVAEKLKEASGDGTTTGIILLRALVREGIKNIASGASPISIKRGIDKATEAVAAAVEKLGVEVGDRKAIENIATVSASGDREIGSLIADAIEKVGKDGVIAIEEGKGTETTLEMVEGMQFDRGYLSPYFCTNAEKMRVEMSEPKLLLTDKKISSAQEILPILQATAASGGELCIVAEDIEGEALSTLVINRVRGTLKVCAVKAPGFGDKRKAMLEDIAALTGATVISEEKGMSLKEAGAEVLGSADKIEVTKDATTIVGGSGNVQARIAIIEQEERDAKSSYDKEQCQKRKAKLAGGVAVIRVGGSTEGEVQEKKRIYEDSLSSTKAAQEKGYVPGGGVALLRASKAVDTMKLSKEEMVGARIVQRACYAPFKQIVENCGVESSVILEEVLSKDGTIGFNALTEQVEDLLEAEIIDPVKIVANSLIYAGDTAGVILLSEVLIGDAPEDDE